MPRKPSSPPRKTTRGRGQATPARPTPEQAAQAIATLLAWMGEEPEREGLRSTPERVAGSLARLTDRGGASLEEILAGSVFKEKDAGLVLVRDIEFYSLCEHHLLPFFGRCHVAYLPAGRIVGFSKIPRLVDHFARRLQVQERLTQEIARGLESAIRPRGVACVVEAFHLCMAMRGVQKERAVAVTTTYRGVFEREPERRGELGGLLDAGGSFKI